MFHLGRTLHIVGGTSLITLVEMTIDELLYQFCRSLVNNDEGTLRDNTEPCYGIIGAI